MNYHTTDPEFMERFEHFAFDEAANEKEAALEPVIRYTAILSALIGCGGTDAYREMLPAALEAGLSPVAVKEIVYQAADYLGMGRMWAFLGITNEVFTEKGIPLPLAGQAATTMEDRLEKGAAVQAEISGESMRDAWKAGPIHRFLAANCFGDYYTRGGLSLAEREMITFCFLMAQGGCEPQLTAHVKGNRNLGNDRAFLTKVVPSVSSLYRLSPQSLRTLLHRKSVGARRLNRISFFCLEFIPKGTAGVSDLTRRPSLSIRAPRYLHFENRKYFSLSRCTLPESRTSSAPASSSPQAYAFISRPSSKQSSS